ncbi:MAG: aminopeptidase [Treponema sp.]|jgi:predicted aminopeptidase|nr:aminopeptidase [Treponema sp.]
MMKIAHTALLVFPALGAVIILLGVSALFSGCYTLKQGAAMLGYLSRAVPLKNLEDAPGADPAVQGENRRFAERVQDIRRFALEELGLRESANYTKYVDLKQDYLAAVVSASAQDSFSRYEWWFPVVGKVPYKGFFNPADARKEAEKLRKKGLDVWVRGVGAFSTLGWFQDPLYSYMRAYPADRLADLIIHETLHATVYLKNQSQFNEELAEFVGSTGARLYIEKTFGPDSPEYRRIDEAAADNAVFLDFIRGLIAELDGVYQSGLTREEKLYRKEEIISAAKNRFEATYHEKYLGKDYLGFPKLAVNNAYLELYRLYYAEDRFFQDLYERSGRDLPRFIAAAKTISPKGGSPRLQLEQALLGQAHNRTD